MEAVGGEQTDSVDVEDPCIPPKTAKKVLAPFLRTLKKKEAVLADSVREEFQQFYLRRKPAEVLKKLSTFFEDSLALRTLLNETSEIMRSVTRSKGVNVYLADYQLNLITQCPKYIQNSDRDLARFKIESGSTLAAYVAFSKEIVIEQDVLGDLRFPDGIPGLTKKVKAVMCIPILTNAAGNCIGVIELYRDCDEPVYNEVDLQICVAVSGWMGIAIQQNNDRLSALRRIEIHEYLGSVIQLFFDGALTFDKIVSDFIKFAKAAVKAEKGSFFVFDEVATVGSEEDIVASVYEEGIGHKKEPMIFKKKTKARFAKDQPGTIGYAARFGEVINIRDAYLDDRFRQEEDLHNFRTRALLSVPIKSTIGVVGVLRLCNKLEGQFFTKEDEDVIRTLSVYAILACQFDMTVDAAKKSEQKLSLLTDLLQVHIKPSPEDLHHFKALPVLNEQQMPSGFFGFEWYVGNYEEEATKYALHILLSSNVLEESCLDFHTAAEFVLTVKKAYRNLPYHNFEHAFTTFHCMFNIISRNKDRFTVNETVSLLIAALCHNVDHLGLTNSFLELVNSPISLLYGEHPQEHHHFQVCMIILQATDFLSNFSSDEFGEIVQEIERRIMATDLASFFPRKIKLVEIINAGRFDWEDVSHRDIFKDMLMTCSDQSGHFKPFDVAKQISESVYRELYYQGDMEKGMGLVPLPNMDRDKMWMIPDNHVCFLSIVCMPCVDIVVSLLPNVEHLSTLCRDVLDKWKEVLELRGVDIWKPDESIKKDRRSRGRLTSNYSSLRSIYSDARSEFN